MAVADCAQAEHVAYRNEQGLIADVDVMLWRGGMWPQPANFGALTTGRDGSNVWSGQRMSTETQYRVTSPSVANLREESSTKAGVLTQLRTGTIVHCDHIDGEWLYVSVTAGCTSPPSRRWRANSYHGWVWTWCLTSSCVDGGQVHTRAGASSCVAGGCNAARPAAGKVTHVMRPSLIRYRQTTSRN